MHRWAPIRWLFILLVIWLVAPEAVLADNCSDWTPGEVASCPTYLQLRTFLFAAAALLAARQALKSLKKSVAGSGVGGLFGFPYGPARDINRGDWNPATRKWQDRDWTPDQDEWDQTHEKNYRPPQACTGVRG